MMLNLKTQSAKEIFPSSVLTGLGRVNVFCGKNNSGKSTILETIASLDNCSAGLCFDEQVRDRLIEGFAGVRFKAQFSGTVPPRDRFFPEFKRALEAVRSRFPVIFLDSEEEVLRELANEFENAARHQHFELNLKQFGPKWQEFFRKLDPSRILLPPKRNLQAVESNKIQQNIERDGSWLLNKLFFCKNQSESSRKYELYRTVKRTFEDVSAGFTFDIVQETQPNVKPPEYLVALKFKNLSLPDWVDADACGLGLRELLVIVYFAVEPEFETVLIEEPENHVHPEMQRRLLRFLSEGTEKQYFISTHSNIFLNTTYVNKVFHVAFSEGKIHINDATKRTEILNELGYSVSDNLVSDLIILVEGPKDTPIIEEYLKKYEIDADFNIKTWALGGDIMGQVDLTVFAERYKVMALIDNDPKSGRVRDQFVKKCQDLNISVTRLERYAIENYFSLRALREVFGAQISEDISSLVSEKPLEEQIKINVKNNNRKLAQKMTVEEIEDTDLNTFFINVRKVCEAT